MTEVTFHPINVYRLIVHQLDEDRNDLTWDTLRPVAQSIKRAVKRVDEVSGHKDEEYSESVAEEAARFTEALVGVAFVICQTAISEVVSTVHLLHRNCQHREKRSLNTTNGKRPGIMRLDSGGRIGGYTRIEVMDAAANFYKHGSDWPSEWEDIDETTRQGKQQKANADILMAAGATGSFASPLRRVAETLGSGVNYDVLVFAEMIDEWRACVRGRYVAELTALRLSS